MQKQTKTKKNKLRNAFIAAVSLLMMLPAAAAVHAEGETDTETPVPTEAPAETNTDKAEDKSDLSEKIPDTLPIIPENMECTLTVRYFDDSDETAPIKGAEFEVFQVASIGKDVNNNGAYIPLDDSLSFSDADDADAYKEKVEAVYKRNPNLGWHDKKETADSGLTVFAGMPAGAYFVEETKAAQWHTPSIPFLVSVPEASEGHSGRVDHWNFDVNIFPKPNLTGNLTAEKILQGADANDNDVFHFHLMLPEGEFKCRMPDGCTDTVRNGDEVAIKGGQSFTIIDLPDNSEYKITEVEEGGSGYTTTYKDNAGRIKYAEEITASVTNTKDNVNTSVSDGGIGIALCCFGGAAAMIVLILFMLRKGRKDKEADQH